MSRSAKANTVPASRIPSQAWVGLVVLLVSACLLFCRLGHYAFWDDEAGLALVAEGVWRTGDTSAVLDHNVFAARDGYLLRNLHDRSNPPLPAYFVAPFIGLSGSAWAGRFPIALCGVACVALMLWWLWKENADLLM